MFSIVTLDHVVLFCRDSRKSLDFYCRILGCELERTVESLPLYQLRAGQALIDLRPGEPPVAHGNMDHFCLRITPFNADELRDYLQQSGVRVLGEVSRRYGATGFGDSLYIEDPDGNCVELKSGDSD